jgi:integrase
MMVPPMKLPQFVYRVPSRHGKERVYFWRGRGHRRIRIREAPGTSEFHARVAELLRQSEAGTTKLAPHGMPGEGTMRWLWMKVSTDKDYMSQTDDRTRYVTALIVEKMLTEPVAPGSEDSIGDMPIRYFTRDTMEALRDRRADTPEAANNLVKRVRAMFRRAIKKRIGGITANPCDNVERLAPKRVGGFPQWTPANLDKFEERHPVGTKAHLALGLLQYLGVRRSDVPVLGRQHVRDGKIVFRMHKGRRRASVPALSLPIITELQRIIDASQAAGITGELTFLVTEYGKAFTSAGFGNWFRTRCDEAELFGLSAHGVRKAAATRAAENGATAHQLMAMFGWLTLKQAELYTRLAERARLSEAGMDTMARRNKAGA